MFGTDPTGIACNACRGAVKANVHYQLYQFCEQRRRGQRHLLRAAGAKGRGAGQLGPGPTPILAQQLLQILLQVPAGGTTPAGSAYLYSANSRSVADVNGDGDYEFVAKRTFSNARHNSQSGYRPGHRVDATNQPRRLKARQPRAAGVVAAR